MLVKDIEQFVINHLFRPYAALYDKRCWSNTPDYNKNLEAQEILKEYEIKLRKNPNNIVFMLEENKEFRSKIFERLNSILSSKPIKWYRWLKCEPLMSYVNRSLFELQNGPFDTILSCLEVGDVVYQIFTFLEPQLHFDFSALSILRIYKDESDTILNISATDSSGRVIYLSPNTFNVSWFTDKLLAIKKVGELQQQDSE